MSVRRGLVWPAVALLLTGCEPTVESLRMAVSTEEPAPSVVEAMTPLLADVGLSLSVAPDDSPAHIFESVSSGAVDLAVVEEPPRVAAGVMTIASLYPSVLHVLLRADAPAGDLASAIRGRQVYAGPVGGSAERLLRQLADDLGLAPAEFEILPNPWASEPDVYFVFGGLLSADSLRQLAGYRLFSFGDVSELGHGSLAEGIALRYPNLRPFVLPRQVYPSLGAAPALTLATRSLLVARESLGEETAYAIAEQLLTHAQEIGAVYPLTTRELNGDLDAANLTLPLHPGARRYLERDRPGLLERYAEVLALLATLLIALISGGFALLNRGRRRKKDRVDVYYGRVLELRAQADGATREVELAGIYRTVADLQREVFGLVIDERIAADESLSVFLALSNQVLAEIDRRLPTESSDAPAALPPRAAGPH